MNSVLLIITPVVVFRAQEAEVPKTIEAGKLPSKRRDEQNSRQKRKYG